MKILFLLTLLTYTFAQGNIWVNSYVEKRNLTLVPCVNFITRSRFGTAFFGVINPQANLTGFAFLSEGTRRKFVKFPVIWVQVTGNFTNLFEIPLERTNSTAVLQDKYQERILGRIYDEVEYTIELPLIFLSNNTKIFVGKSTFLI